MVKTTEEEMRRVGRQRGNGDGSPLSGNKRTPDSPVKELWVAVTVKEPAYFLFYFDSPVSSSESDHFVPKQLNPLPSERTMYFNR